MQHLDMLAYACICLHMQSYACICMHMNTYAFICMHMHAHARSQPPTQSHRGGRVFGGREGGGTCNPRSHIYMCICI